MRSVITTLLITRKRGEELILIIFSNLTLVTNEPDAASPVNFPVK